jgi:mannosyltransferase
MPPPWRPGDPAVQSAVMQTSEGGSGAANSNLDVTDPQGAENGTTPVELKVIGVIAVVAGVVLRFTTRSSLWLDEALSVNIARLPIGDISDALRHDGHPPLYYVLLHVWSGAFGTGDVAVRALSGVFGLLTLPLAWIAGRRRGGPVLGWITLTVVALSPFAVRYSDEARMYSLVMFLTFAGYLLVDDVLRRGKDDLLRLAGIAVVAAALLYTHYWALWLLVAAGLMVLWRAWRTDDRKVRAAALKVAVALVVGGVLFVPWLPVMLYQSAHTGTPWADPARPTVALALILDDVGAGFYSEMGFFGAVTAVFALLAVFGRGRDRRHIDLDLRTVRQFRGETVVFVLAFAIGITFSFLAKGAFATRYAAVLFPFLALLVAGGVTRFLARWVRSGVLLALCAMMATGIVWNVSDHRTQAGQIGAAVDANAQPGDLVVYCPDQLGPAGSRAITADVEQVTYPDFGDPRYVDWVDYKARNDAADPEAFAQEVLRRAPADRGLFVVWNGEYKTYEDDCEALVNAIGAARPGEQLVKLDSKYFEHGWVSWYPATS